MKTFAVAASIFLAIPISSTAGNGVKSYRDWSLVSLELNLEEEGGSFCLDAVRKMQEDLMIDLWKVGKSEATFSASPSNLARAKDRLESAKGCSVDRLQIISSNLEEMIRESMVVDADVQDGLPLLQVNENDRDQIKPSSPSTLFHSKYHKHDEIISFFTSLHEEFPLLMTPFTLPGKTFEERDIIGYKIHGFNATPSTKELFYHGGIHAREWIGPATLTYIAEQLVRGYSVNDEITTLLDSFTLAIIPVLNVDGYIYSHEKDRMWRKNRQPTSVFWCTGTDINRNFDAGWSGPGASGNPCSEAYYGSAAFSAPESKAVSLYIESVKPISYIDWHAFSQLFMYPYGYDCKKETKMDKTWGRISKATVQAIKSVHGTAFTAGPICQTIYEASGSSIDWAFDAVPQVRYPFAVELRDTGRFGFLLPAKYIVPSGEEMLKAVLVMGIEIAKEEARFFSVFAQQSVLSITANQPSALSLDSNTLFVATENLIKSYNPATGSDLSADFVGHSAPINSILVLDGQLFSCGQDGTIRQWDIASRKLVKVFSGNRDEVWQVVVDVEGNALLSGGGDNTIRIFDLKTGALQKTIENAHYQRVASLALTKDFLYTGGFDNLAKEWSRTTWTVTRTFTGHIQGIWSIAVQNGFLYTASDDNLIKRWDLSTGKDIRSFAGHVSHLKCVKVLGSNMFSGGYDYKVIHWNIDSGELIRTYQEQYSYISSIAVNATGGALFAASADNSVKKWSVQLVPLNSTTTSTTATGGTGSSSGTGVTGSNKNSAVSSTSLASVFGSFIVIVLYVA